jgi:peptidoglycan/xylan/chitin deacetylase (PgdA/CDA1 family)
MRHIYITFDVEDFINERSLYSLRHILILLKKYDLKAIFFITGHMAEKISRYPKILKALKEHEIGYHSSQHSVRPGILEFCDVKSYQEAMKISSERETCHINPLTGKAEGAGGLKALRKIFGKEISSFRAPRFAWAPPHLEALAKLGIKFDFSTYISDTVFFHRTITFLPHPIHIDNRILPTRCLLALHPFSYMMSFMTCAYVLLKILKNRVTVLVAHPSRYVNMDWWDSFYLAENPSKLCTSKGLPQKELRRNFFTLEQLLIDIRYLEKMGLVRTMTRPEKSNEKLNPETLDIRKIYERSIYRYVEYYDYVPKYLFRHFLRFFAPADENTL